MGDAELIEVHLCSRTGQD